MYNSVKAAVISNNETSPFLFQYRS